MFLNLSEVLQKENKVVSTQVDAELEQIQLAGQIYPVQAHTPVEITLCNLEKGKAKLEQLTELDVQTQFDIHVFMREEE